LINHEITYDTVLKKAPLPPLPSFERAGGACPRSSASLDGVTYLKTAVGGNNVIRSPAYVKVCLSIWLDLIAPALPSNGEYWLQFCLLKKHQVYQRSEESCLSRIVIHKAVLYCDEIIRNLRTE